MVGTEDGRRSIGVHPGLTRWRIGHPPMTAEDQGVMRRRGVCPLFGPRYDTATGERVVRLALVQRHGGLPPQRRLLQPI